MKDSKDFIKLLGLTGETFSSVSLDGILINVYDFSHLIWQGQRLYNFVDHGIDHSFRVLEIALDMFEKIAPSEAKLTSLERLVLGIASLIHDIGMQYSKYPVAGVTKPPEDIRKDHCELGFEMIRDVREGVFHTDRSGPNLSLEEYHKIFLHYGALVGFSHSGKKYWDMLKDQMYSQKKEGGLELLRLRLLASLIRLADELHCEYTRIPELNWIRTELLSDEGKGHWLACYYTQEIKISSPGTAGCRMVMRWRIPEHALEDDRELIRTLLQDLRESKINQECDLIKEYLKLDEGKEPCFLEFRMSPEPETLGIETLPAEVKQFIRSLRPYQFGVKIPTVSAKVKELHVSAKLDSLKFFAQNFWQTGKGVLSGHFRLKTGWHTNKYVKCRELCSNFSFVDDLCHELAGFYSQHKISDILAIGTSAIRLGGLLSFLLRAKLSYTFGKVNIESTLIGKNDYTDYEMEVTPFDNGNILLIDDILGVGSVIYDVIAKLKSSDNPPKNVRVFTIYSLGDVKKLIEPLTDVEIDYLVSFPDVDYREEDNVTGRCSICKDHPEIIRVEE